MSVKASVTTQMPEVDISAWVPDTNYYRNYVSRKLAGGRSDLQILDHAHEMNYNVLLEGPTGSAKTSLVMAYAAQQKRPLVVIQCNGGADPRQLLGGWVPQADGSLTYAPGDFVLGLTQGAVILLNEINFLPPKIQVVLFGALDLRRMIHLPDAVGSEWPTMLKVHEDTFILADCNPGYIGTRPMNEALRNRFEIKLNWDYDRNVEKKLVPSAALVELAERLRGKTNKADNIRAPISTNMLMEFASIATAVVDDGTPAGSWAVAVETFLSMFLGQERIAAERVFELYADKIREQLGC